MLWDPTPYITHLMYTEIIIKESLKFTCETEEGKYSEWVDTENSKVMGYTNGMLHYGNWHTRDPEQNYGDL